MTIDRAIHFLMDELDSEALDLKAQAFVDRLLLRFMTCPALMSFLDATRFTKVGDEYSLEIVFRKMPPEQLDVIKNLISEVSRTYVFSRDGQTHYGFKIQLTPDELSPTSDSGVENPEGYKPASRKDSQS